MNMRIDLDHERFTAVVSDRPWWRLFFRRVRSFHGLSRAQGPYNEWILPESGIKAGEPLRTRLNTMLEYRRGKGMSRELMDLEIALQNAQEQILKLKVNER